MCSIAPPGSMHGLWARPGSLDDSCHCFGPPGCSAVRLFILQTQCLWCCWMDVAETVHAKPVCILPFSIVVEFFFNLAVLRLSCSTQDLCCHMQDLSVGAHRLFSCGTWALVP